MERNFRARCGEIDLVMRDGVCLVFVEVRYRSSERFGSGLESINRTKQNRLLRAAQVYIKRHPPPRVPPCRFDVCALSGSMDDPHCRWVKDAFR